MEYLLGSEYSPQSIAKDAFQVSINKRRLPFQAGLLDTRERCKAEKKAVATSEPSVIDGISP